MKEKDSIPVRVLRSCVASGRTLVAGTEDAVSPGDFRVLEPLGKIELNTARAEHGGGPAATEKSDEESTPIVELELGDKPTSALLGAGLDTLLEVQAYLGDGNALSGIRGVGEATEEKLLEAVAAAGLGDWREED